MIQHRPCLSSFQHIKLAVVNTIFAYNNTEMKSCLRKTCNEDLSKEYSTPTNHSYKSYNMNAFLSLSSGGRGGGSGGAAGSWGAGELKHSDT